MGSSVQLKLNDFDLFKAFSNIIKMVNEDDKVVLMNRFFWEQEDWHLVTLKNFSEYFEALPKAFEQKDLGLNAVAYLHYFMNGCDLYVIEKSFEGDIKDSYCYIVLNNNFSEARFGYLRNLKKCVLDLEFKPVKLHQLPDIQIKH